MIINNNIVKTRQDYFNLLQETVDYYSENPNLKRAATSDYADGCVYRTDDGRMCAVGRCLNQETFPYEDYNVKTGVDEFEVDEYLLDQYKGYKEEFWSNLQSLHDIKAHWNNKGLTEIGKHKADEIKQWITNNIKE